MGRWSVWSHWPNQLRVTAKPVFIDESAPARGIAPTVCYPSYTPTAATGAAPDRTPACCGRSARLIDKLHRYLPELQSDVRPKSPSGTRSTPADLQISKWRNGDTLDLHREVTREFRLVLLPQGLVRNQLGERLFVEPDRTLVSGDVVQNKVVPGIFRDGGTPSSRLAVLDKVAALNALRVLPDHSAPGDGSMVALEREFSAH